MGSAARASRTGRLKASVLPLAVPVAMTRCSPREARLEGLRLVAVETCEPLRRERLLDLRMKAFGDRDEARLARGHFGDVGKLLAAEELVPDGGDGIHEVRC